MHSDSRSRSWVAAYPSYSQVRRIGSVMEPPHLRGLGGGRFRSTVRFPLQSWRRRSPCVLSPSASCPNGQKGSSLRTVHSAQMTNPEIAIITTDQTG
ncbi:hypothetical protein ALMP_80030 [Streptomyces sp. A012304]|nr:hypothetical protein ALMP_80030 [Streptomyces sp. A012304]